MQYTKQLAAAYLDPTNTVVTGLHFGQLIGFAIHEVGFRSKRVEINMC